MAGADASSDSVTHIVVVQAAPIGSVITHDEVALRDISGRALRHGRAVTHRGEIRQSIPAVEGTVCQPAALLCICSFRGTEDGKTRSGAVDSCWHARSDDSRQVLNSRFLEMTDPPPTTTVDQSVTVCQSQPMARLQRCTWRRGDTHTHR